ncbi:MAG: HNH endonuclease [Candidatus Peribacteraceae bacterium]|nr:HNH endonuclease [Candidatus Peribacteraceae bacterium]
MKNKEIKWLPVVGFDGYEVSSSGLIMSTKGGRLHLMSNKEQRYGYEMVNLFSNGRKFPRLIHRLVLEAFVGPRPSGMQCRHLDGDGSNNRLDNLLWGTVEENMTDRDNHGKTVHGKSIAKSKLSPEKVRAIRILYDKTEATYQDLADLFDVTRATVYKAANKDTWARVA